jgi:glutathione S-transferase
MSGELVLYTIPGSHACRATILMLEHKRMGWRERVLIPGVQTTTMKLRGFPRRTVPALRIDGERVQTNREIARFLDRARPEPALVPAGREGEIEEAERFIDGLLQPIARRLALAAGRRDLALLANDADSGRLGAILAPSRWRRRLAVWGAHRYFGIDKRVESLDLAALPRVLDQVDSLVSAGTLNGAELNAADFQAAPCLALMGYRLDIRDVVASRPSWALVERLLPEPPNG